MTLEHALLIAIGVLSGVVSMLFVWFRAEFMRCQSRELECAKSLIEFSTRVATLESQRHYHELLGARRSDTDART